MDDLERIQAACTEFARRNIALNARVTGVEFDAEHGVWLGSVTGSTGSCFVVARPLPDGSYEVHRYVGVIRPTRPKPNPQP